MKVSSVLLTVSAVASSVTAQRVLPVGLSKPTGRAPPVHKRATTTYTQLLNNNVTGAGYYAAVSVGSPPQNVTLVLDTGSSDVWLLSNTADLCQSRSLQKQYGYCLATYNQDDSSTYHLVSEGSFQISYVDNSGAAGNYIKDDLSVGGATITQLQMGLASNSTIPSGLMGVGYSTNEAAKSEYPNIMDVFKSEGLIAAKAYSLYLNDYDSSTGTILFGGIDTEKFIGNLIGVPVQPDSQSGVYSSFTVALSSVSLNANGSTSSLLQKAIPAILDSGTTLTYLPSSAATELYTKLDAYDDTQGRAASGLVYVDCKYLGRNISFDFQFGGTDGPVIAVPIDEMIFNNVDEYQDLGLDLPSDLPFTDACTLGLMSSEDYYLLGDTFLRSAYVVYDLDNNEVALAQANLNSTQTNIVEISASASQIPEATGVASQVSVTQTATGLPGKSGSSGTSIPTVTVTGSTTGTTASASGNGNAGRRSVPAPDWQAVGVAAIAGVGILLGGVVFVS
ncbi:aspartic peptidase domain-containing protein [Xylariales sp. AK1849]|nr:aspartic peptidase domain-containing protein [Xylariales sp. AK1849]